MRDVRLASRSGHGFGRRSANRDEALMPMLHPLRSTLPEAFR